MAARPWKFESSPGHQIFPHTFRPFQPRTSQRPRHPPPSSLPGLTGQPSSRRRSRLLALHLPLGGYWITRTSRVMTRVVSVRRCSGAYRRIPCVGGRSLRPLCGSGATASRHRGKPREDLAAAWRLPAGRGARHPSSSVIPCAVRAPGVIPCAVRAPVSSRARRSGAPKGAVMRRRHGTAFATPWLPASSRSSGASPRRPAMAPVPPPPSSLRGGVCRRSNPAPRVTPLDCFPLRPCLAVAMTGKGTATQVPSRVRTPSGVVARPDRATR